MSREEEVELAKSIEDANRALLDAVARSPVALAELAGMVEELEEGLEETTELEEGLEETTEMTSSVVDDERDRKQMAAELLSAAQRVQQLQVRSSTERDEQAEAARARFVERTLEYGLTHGAIDRLLTQLVAARSRHRGAARTELDSTIEVICRNRDAAARAKASFIEANIGLVMWMARKRSHPALPLHDLVQEGSMGLMRAIEKFDYRRGIRFATYAAWWIRAYINRAVSDQSRTIRIPVHLLETRHKVSRIAQAFSQERGREPSEPELSRQTGVPMEKIRAVASLPKQPVSMDSVLGPDNETKVSDFVAHPVGVTVLEEISAKHVGRRLRSLLETLSPREQEVLRLRFGIDRPDCLTCEQVGRRFSLSRERIRQIEAEALSKLRGRAAAEELDSHLSN